MGNGRTAGCALVLFGSLVLCASSVLGQPCLPVVYAFRHAEDWNPSLPPPNNTALTQTGTAHAALYPTMISDFQAANNFCPVAKVYATTTADKETPCGMKCTSTTNPFETAKPLARAVMAADPITTVGNGVKLYEYLGNGNDAPTSPNYSTVPAKALRTELLATANRGESSAIFWTSQGLHVLGGVIINKASNVPDKNAANPVTPPRNAVYLFTAVGSAPNIARFSDTRSDSTRSRDIASSVYVQCFNHVEPTLCPDIQNKTLPDNFIHDPDVITSPPTPLYVCGYGSQSNLGGTPDKCANGQCGTIPNDRNQDIKGKICNTTSPMLADTVGPSISSRFGKECTDMFGVCK